MKKHYYYNRGGESKSLHVFVQNISDDSPTKSIFAAQRPIAAQ